MAAACMGNAHAAGPWQGLAPLFIAERISWALHGPAACGVPSVLFAILGERDARGTWRNVDGYAAEPMNLMRKRAANSDVKSDESEDDSWF